MDFGFGIRRSTLGGGQSPAYFHTFIGMIRAGAIGIYPEALAFITIIPLIRGFRPDDHVSF